jgi:hypothetical protein
VLRPPAADFFNTPNATSSLMSRNAVSGEHLAMAAHLLLGSVPTNCRSAPGCRQRFSSQRQIILRKFCGELVSYSPRRDVGPSLRLIF